MSTPAGFDVEVIAARPLAPMVRELTLARADGGALDFAPGQWVNLVLPLEEGELRRAYSIASPPDGTPQFELAVTHVAGGPGSAYLHEVQPGTRLRAIGPHGFFTRPADDGHPSLFVATGTGVTPLRSMVLAALRAGSAVPLWVLLGVRHERDLLYRDEFTELSRRHSNFRALFTLSRPDVDWTGRRGYVQQHLPELWSELAALGHGEPHLYVCGLERMVSAVRSLARKELGAARAQVHSERYD